MPATLNLRIGPGTAFDIRATLKADEVYVAVSQVGDWIEIWYDDAPGWIHVGYTKAPPATTVLRAVMPDFLNVRAGPSASDSLLGRIYGGSLRAILESRGDWRRFDFGGKAGWALGSFLGDPGQAPPIQSILPTRPRSQRGYIQLPAAAPGLFAYGPASRLWGMPRLVYALERIGQRWLSQHPTWTRMGVGDIGYAEGGPISGHASHQKGVDVDIKLMRKDALESGTTIQQTSYSRERTAALIALFQENLPIKYIFFNDTTVAGTSTWPNHDNHFHVRTLE